MRKVLVLVVVLLLSSQATARTALVTEAQIPGGTLHITILEPVDEDKAAEIVEWLRAASTSVSLAYGRFPNPAASVIVENVVAFEAALHAHARANAVELMEKLNSTGGFDEEIQTSLKALLDEFKATGAY